MADPIAVRLQKLDDAADASKHEVLSEGPGVLAVRVLDLAGLKTPVRSSSAQSLEALFDSWRVR